MRKNAEVASEVNPLEAVANISDVMLVFAVALMLALLAHWGVNASESATLIDAENMQKVDSSTASDVIDSETGKGYQEVGKIVRDPDTGDDYAVLFE
jgi:hypothetical protein